MEKRRPIETEELIALNRKRAEEQQRKIFRVLMKLEEEETDD